MNVFGSLAECMSCQTFEDRVSKINNNNNNNKSGREGERESAFAATTPASLIQYNECDYGYDANRIPINDMTTSK